MSTDLEKQVRSAILNSTEYDKYLKIVAKKINEESRKANSEETIASRIEFGLKDALGWHSVDFNPIREENVKSLVRNRVTSKRIDSRFKNIVSEYKKDIFKQDLGQNTQQLFNYLSTLSENEKQPLDQYIGILNDGVKVRFISFDRGRKNLSSVTPFDSAALKEIVKIYLSIDKKDLSSRNLLQDFSIVNDNRITRSLVNALYKGLLEPSDKTYMLHSEWERLFQLASQNKNNLKTIKDRDKALSDCFDINAADFNGTKALFVLQTAYTIIIKLVAYLTISQIVFNKTKLQLESLLQLDSKSLRNTLEYIENGEIFHDLGIINLLEGGFFSWYVYQAAWNDDMYHAIRSCISLLLEYDSNQYLFNKHNIHDLFNDLYESIIPREVRHSLGEYYTPQWLAEHVIENIEKKANWRALDPCAGSGTFILKLIQKIKDEDHPKEDLLKQVLKRVKAIDINPLAILTCRVNYFIAISHLIDFGKTDIEIPVFLGDSTRTPSINHLGNVTMINYSLETKKGEINFSLPISVASHENELTKHISFLEEAIVNKDKDKALNIFSQYLNTNEKKKDVIDKIKEFIENLIYLENQKWDRIWIRIIVGFLRIATLGEFDVIVGNPPWIDWKTLPDGYRESLKKVAIEKHLFSGDIFTGGINLNICALIASTVANNWLSMEGMLGFLMPKSIVFQQSYSGFRKLYQKDGINLKYIKFYDWTDAGKPFYPVTEKFMTYYFKKTKESQKEIVPVIKYRLKKRGSLKFLKSHPLSGVLKLLEKNNGYCFLNKGTFNHFTFESNLKTIPLMKKLAGSSIYEGRVGLGIYPKELLLFKIVKKLQGKAIVENFQGKSTERKFVKKPFILETKYLFPVIEGPNIDKFSLKNVAYVAPFPYEESDIRKPIPPDSLRKKSPFLFKYYLSNKFLMKKTDYNQRVQGKKGAFYSLTRVGKYSFAPYRVIYRNNSKWAATVIATTQTKWGGRKPYLLLDHACSVAQDTTGTFITEDEAHYICCILNSSLVSRYILNSSDSRSFKTDLIVKIVKYSEAIWVHKALSKISKLSHINKSHWNEQLVDYLLIRYINESIEVSVPSKENIYIERKINLSDKNWIKRISSLLPRNI